MNMLPILVYDTETGGLDSKKHDLVQIAAKAYDGRTLQPIPIDRGGEFQSLIKPTADSRVDDKALEVNKKTREELAKAPDAAVVWPQFISWVNGFNPKASKYEAPIAAGMNIRNFDNLFVAEYNKKFSPKKEKTLLFNSMKCIDLMDIMFLWFESNDDLPNFKLTTMMSFLGMDTSGAHDAMNDVRATGEIIIRFLKLHRNFYKRIKFQG